MPLDSLWVLNDRNNLRIGKNLLGFVVHGAKVIASKKGSSEQGPERHVREIFVVLHSAVADLKHVGIVPMSRTGELLEPVLAEADHGHAIVVIADVSCRAPEVPGMRAPSPWCLHSPVAYAEDHGAFRLREGVAKFGVLHFWIEAFGMAPVNFDVVHAPVCISIHVLDLMIITSWPLLTSEPSSIGVHTQFQPFAMDVIREPSNAGREAFSIGDNDSAGITADLPAVVNIHVLIAKCLHSAAHHGVGRFANQRIADVAGKLIPAVPPHRGSESELSLPLWQCLRARNSAAYSRVEQTVRGNDKKEQTYHPGPRLRKGLALIVSRES